LKRAAYAESGLSYQRPSPTKNPAQGRVLLLEYKDYYQWANAENETLMREFGHFYELQGF